MKIARALPLVALAALVACGDTLPTNTTPDSQPLALKTAPGASRYIILGRGNSLPSDLAARIAASGGTLEKVIPEIGVAFATGTADFANRVGRIASIETVFEDEVIEWTDPQARDLTFAEMLQAEAVTPNTNPFYFLQWAPGAIDAPGAWNAGYTGAGVRVAILDGAIYNAHVDLQGAVDVAASASFVPGFNYNQDVGTFWHGTHVAGIVGARDNNLGVVGIAPGATLIGVKVLHSGSGAFSWILDGIIYAAKPQSQGGAGANIINMSLGATPNVKNKTTKAAWREVVKAFDRATTYAHQQGVTVIASAGNSGRNFDEEKELFKIPAQNLHVISVASTGPFGWAYGNTDYSRPASYTDHGKSLVTVAAPGGDFDWPTNEACNVGGVINPCWAFDMVLSTSRGTTANGGYTWSAGTSMAAPAASAVAALIIEKNGGSMHPSQVRTTLQRSAIDLGKPGNDEWYGHGWINAARAVQ